MKYNKIPKISHGAYIFQRLFRGAYIRRGLCTQGNLRFKIDWASLLLEENLLFSFVLLCFWGQIPSLSPQGLIFGGAI